MGMSLRIKVFGFLLLLISAALFQACSEDSGQQATGGTTPTVEAQWTVLFYGAGKSTADVLEDGQSRMIASLQSLGNVFPSDQVRCLALLATTVGDQQCRFLTIDFHPHDSGNELSATELGNWGTRDMSSPVLLQQFVDSAIQRAPAEHYMLIIGGEGDGWKGSCRDEINGAGRVLPHSELDAAIQNVATPRGPFHVDLLLWLTPGMGNFEIAYEFRDVADYVVSVPSVADQPGFMALDQWYLDLILDPAMEAERLGQFVVSRMQQRSHAGRDSLSTFDLLDTSQMSVLANAVDDLSTALTAAVPSRGPAILTMWQELWDVRTDDSSSIDLRAFARALQANPDFAEEEAVRAAAAGVESALAQVAVYQRSTRADLNRDGVMIYAPLVANEEESALYGSLKLSRERASWTNFLHAMAESGTDLCNVTGQISWPGQTLHDLYLFLNTARTGAPDIYLVTPANINNVLSPSLVDYRSAFALPDASVDAYIGAFLDIDFSGGLSTGDRFGYYHRSHPLRDWMTIDQGAELDSISIVLTNTF